MFKLLGIGNGEWGMGNFRFEIVDFRLNLQSTISNLQLPIPTAKAYNWQLELYPSCSNPSC
ncbi:hypothetical protein [Microseira wollei]|uniref:Uncharacterized protein n=1 Tax=Microseira wollei NIES-4236 TaxID=2530354 RepID=A0AAV3XQ18_9CYAN|nr:hypothetical protein [Microseira wollei]GET43230.1 hypothetical protein MiSe_80520 [Microseira wollei NIES-4236]